MFIVRLDYYYLPRHMALPLKKHVQVTFWVSVIIRDCSVAVKWLRTFRLAGALCTNLHCEMGSIHGHTRLTCRRVPGRAHTQ